MSQFYTQIDSEWDFWPGFIVNNIDRKSGLILLMEARGVSFNFLFKKE